MDDESVLNLERRLAAGCGEGAPGALRDVVLRDVRRELRSSRWDRWLGRAAAALVALGVGMNGAVGWWGERGMLVENRGRGARDAEASLAVAAVVAEATDAETGRRVARQMAAFGGWELTGEQAAAIDAAAAGTRQSSGFGVQGSGVGG